MNKNYDVAVYGLWYGNNYGSIITYYALTKILDTMGMSYAMVHNPLEIESEADIDSLERSHPLRFAKEKYDITPILPLHELNKLNKSFRAFLIGSDQMWNYDLSKPYKQSYFLDFVDEDKIKVAYATSFGQDKYFGPPEAKELTQKNLRRFDAISVRDNFSEKICRDYFHIPVEQALDPVFLVERDIYDNLIMEAPDFTVEDDFIFAYILDPNLQIGQSIEKISNITGKKIVIVFDQLGDKIQQRNALGIISDNVEYYLNATVKEWLYLFKNAGFIITDSFHGVCFSIIYRKPFIAMQNNIRGHRRIPHLLEKFGLTDYMIKSPEEMIEKFMKLGIDHQIDYKNVFQKLDDEKNVSLNWLQRALTSPRKDICKMLDKNFCTGCSACVNICPVNALSLQQDKFGYYRSSIDLTICINCGKCSKICPAFELPEKKNESRPKLYIFACKDDELLKASSSGGIFSMLAKYVLRKDGVVAGAAWNKDFSVQHIFIEKEQELELLQKSKYLQSYMGDIFRQVYRYLKAGRYVLFSGCPCQVAGLKSYLGKEYSRLLLVDILCGYAPSVLFFEKYRKEKFGDKLAGYQFRNKELGTWNSYTSKITFTDGTEEKCEMAADDYQKVFHSHIMTPRHCENCKYQALPRFGDISIGDIWGISKRDPSLDTKKGLSAVLINNKKGQAFFKHLKDSQIELKREVPLEWLGANGSALPGSHGWASPRRNRFYDAVLDMPFSKAVEQALAPDVFSNCPNALKISPLHYDTTQLHFQYNTDIWEEHWINGKIILTTRMERPSFGHFISLPLLYTLEKGENYHLSIRFKVKSEADNLTFHIKESGSKELQIIYIHKIRPENAIEWTKIEVDFNVNRNTYGQFSFGAAQVTGKSRYIMIDYINITKQ